MAKIRDKDSLTFKEATAQMSRKEKSKYIWEYYKWFFISGFATIFMVGTFIHQNLTAVDTYLDISIVTGAAHMNIMFSDDWQDFEDVNMSQEPRGIGVDPYLRETLTELFVPEELHGDYSVVVSHHNLTTTAEAFVALAAVGIFDIFITYPDDLAAMSEVGHLYNIAESDMDWNLPTDYFYNDYALYLHRFPFFENYIRPADELVLAIAINSNNQARIYDLLNLVR